MSKNPKYASRDKLLKYGQAFFYADSNNKEFRISTRGIADPQSAIGATVTQAIDAVKSKVRRYY